MRLNLDYLVETMWEHLNLIKVFTKKRGRKLRDQVLKFIFVNLNQ